MAVESAVASKRYAAAPRRGAVTRVLENERWFAFFLLLPTAGQISDLLAPLGLAESPA